MTLQPKAPWLVLAAAALVSLMAWAIASPPGSSPDDDFHLSSIWCARGDAPSRCASVPGQPNVRVVPEEVSGVACFAFDGAKSAECQAVYDGRLTPDTPRDHGNWNGEYPPLFYSSMSVFVTDSLGESVLLMRMANALLAVIMLGALAVLLPGPLRHLVILPPLVTSVPLGLALFSSTNPSGWAILSAATLWPALYAAFEAKGRRRTALLVFSVVAACLGIGARADACLFVVLAVVTVLFLRLRSLKGNRAALCVALGCVLLAITVFFSAGQSSALSSGLDSPSTGTGWFQLTVSNAQSIPVVIFGSLGFGVMGGLGWLDTPSPLIVGTLTVLVWSGVTFAAWKNVTARQVIAIVGLGMALLGYPLIVLAQTGAVVGTEFQPRYVLPLLVLLTGISLVGAYSATHPSVLQSVAVVVALSVANSLALFTQLRRYVTGLDESGFDLNRNVEWWWGGPLSPQSVWLIGTIAFCVLSTMAVRLTRAGDAS